VALAQWNGALLVTDDSRLLKLDPPPSIVTPREFPRHVRSEVLTPNQ